VEAAGIEPALLLAKSLGCVSMLAECCYFSSEIFLELYRQRESRKSASKGRG